jgi:hypothetical protein
MECSICIHPLATEKQKSKELLLYTSALPVKSNILFCTNLQQLDIGRRVPSKGFWSISGVNPFHQLGTALLQAETETQPIDEQGVWLNMKNLSIIPITSC